MVFFAKQTRRRQGMELTEVKFNRELTDAEKRLVLDHGYSSLWEYKGKVYVGLTALANEYGLSIHEVRAKRTAGEIRRYAG